MILQASLIGGWEKLELWDHTHMALFGLLILVCILEVILLKITTSAGLFTRPQHHYHNYDSDYDYDDSGEYEEDIYYEDITNNYDQYARRQMRYRQQQQEQERQIIQQYYNQQQQQQPQHQQQQYFYNYHEQNPQNNYLFYNYHTHSTDVFRFVY